MRNLCQTVAQIIRDSRGQGTVEYALVIGIVSVAMIAVLAGASLGWLNSITGSTTSAIGDLFS